MVLVVLALLAAVAVEWAIRAGEPRTVAPTGVDTLTIPLAEPDPDRFVDGVDHPWWPMRPGEGWQWEDTSGASTRWLVTPGPEVAGVATTSVQLDDRVLDLAQDRDGHLWVLASRPTDASGPAAWTVQDGAPAGLLLAAEPRRGDGHVLAAPEGSTRARIEVGERSDEPLVTPAGTLDDTLTITLVDARAGEFGTSTRIVLARGVGPVRVSSLAEGSRRLARTLQG